MRLLLVFLLMLEATAVVRAQVFPEKPDPPRLVNDFAGILNEAEQNSLEIKLVAYHDSTSTQIAIVTVTDLHGYDASNYSFELAENWGIGQRGKDNGMLILIAPNQRRMFIATGYGLEANVPDAIAKRIIEKTLKPNFQNGDYYTGLDQATNIIMGLLSGQFSPQQLEEEFSIWPLLLLLAVFILVIYFISRGRGGGKYYDPDSRTIMGPYRGSSTWGDFRGGRGSFGGSSGGGFGGFGGGSFGGGGAGGSW